MEYAERRFRPKWTWVAEDGGRIVARALWWGRSDGAWPIALDCLHVVVSVPDRAALATALLVAGQAELATGGVPRNVVTLDDGWRTEPP